MRMIAILGTGKMGEALLSGLLRAGWPPSAVVAAARREDRAAELRERYGVPVTDASTAAKMADTVVLAVKPQDMGKLLEQIAPALPPDRLVVSVAAGITTAFIERRLAGAGARMRVYLPYGGDWYAYLVRRLAERPANLAFFLRSLGSKNLGAADDRDSRDWQDGRGAAVGAAARGLAAGGRGGGGPARGPGG